MARAMIGSRHELDHQYRSSPHQGADGKKGRGGEDGGGVGEGLVESLQAAIKEKRPYILFVASGGARMQEGILSLMQMPRTTICVDMLREAGLPYVVVLTA